MLDWIKNNKTASTLAVLIPVAAIVMGSMQGCSVDSLIKHDVPPNMRDANGGQAKVSLRDSPFVRDAFVDDVERDLQRFDIAAEEAAIIRDIIASAVNLGLDQVSESAFPGGLAVLGLLTTLVGIYSPKPGDRAREEARVSRQAQDSYNKGREDALREIKEGTS